MKNFCFTVDDNIRFLKEINENAYRSIFDHPYLAMLKHLHKRFGLKVQLNLFFETDGFDLSMMTDSYASEWEANSDWLKLSFHSRLENVRPYEFSGYDEVFAHCETVNREIKRFAGEKSLARTTTLHYCLATQDGLQALADNGIKGLLGLFGDEIVPMSSYGINETDSVKLRNGGIVNCSDIYYAGIDIVLNCFDQSDILDKLKLLSDRYSIKVMIHEQYFYPDYHAYQEDFEEKLSASFDFLVKNGYESVFFQDLIPVRLR